MPADRRIEQISSNVARLFKAERQARGISLNLLAEKAGLSRQTISYVEQEVQSPSLDTLLRIAFALEVNLDEIVGQARKGLAKQSSVRRARE